MDHYYNQNEDFGYYDQPTHATGQAMATAALLLGIAATATIWTLFMPMALGCLGFICAYLSKGFEQKLAGNARVGVTMAATAIAISVVIMAAGIVAIMNEPSLAIDYGRQMDQMVFERFGQTTESLLGKSYEAVFADFFASWVNSK
jgi:predicted PurR-regulated permease PerM